MKVFYFICCISVIALCDIVTPALLSCGNNIEHIDNSNEESEESTEEQNVKEAKEKKLLDDQFYKFDAKASKSILPLSTVLKYSDPTLEENDPPPEFFFFS